MTPPRILLVPLVALIVSGCASSYRVVQVPQYGADLYPQSQTRSGVTVAVDEIKNAQRAERLFGADLIKAGILPVNVVVSNFGKQRMVLKPSDILLAQGKDVIDPIPVEMVLATAKSQKFLRSGTETEVNKYFEEATFKETTLLPSQTYRGVMFFAVPAQKKQGMDRFFTSWSVYTESGPKVRVGVTNLDSGERVLFAPFPIKLPENAGAYSY